MPLSKMNGVKMVNCNCDKCVCKECKQWDPILRENDYISCPFNAKPCNGCDKLVYVEQCLFRN